MAAQALEWLADHDADPVKITRAGVAFASKDYATGFEELDAAVAEARKQDPNDQALEDIAAAIVLARHLVGARIIEHLTDTTTTIARPDSGAP